MIHDKNNKLTSLTSYHTVTPTVALNVSTKNRMHNRGETHTRCPMDRLSLGSCGFLRRWYRPVVQSYLALSGLRTEVVRTHPILPAVGGDELGFFSRARVCSNRGERERDRDLARVTFSRYVVGGATQRRLSESHRAHIRSQCRPVKQNPAWFCHTRSSFSRHLKQH